MCTKQTFSHMKAFNIKKIRNSFGFRPMYVFFLMNSTDVILTNNEKSTIKKMLAVLKNDWSKTEKKIR